MHAVCSLHVLERLLHVMSYTPFVDLLASLLSPHPGASKHLSHDTSIQFSDQHSDRLQSGSQASTSQPNSSSMPHPSPPQSHNAEAAVEANRAASEGQHVQQPSPWLALFALHEHSLAYRGCFLSALQGSDSQLCSAAVRTMVAVVQSKAVSPGVLSTAGRLPLCSARQA